MSSLSVVGLQWGDEAKGKLVDLLTERHDIVVRYQGGANAGHTVVVGDQVYKLHHIPSGILNPRAINVVAAGVVIHPQTILAEIQSLTSRGLDIAGRLLLSDRAHVVMPWHIIEDQLWHAASAGDDNIGTTLRGIGPCYRDKVGRSHAIRLGDLDQPHFADRIRCVAEVKHAMLQSLPGGRDVQWDTEKILGEFLQYANALRPYIADTTNYLLDAVEAGKRILFEGAQGSLLDIDHGTFPFVTSSNSSGVGVSAGSGVAARWIDRTMGVAKAYSTRVGGGPFPTELNNEIGEHIRVKGNEFGTTTGRPRRCGWFDAVAVRYTRRLGGVHAIALMMLDVLSDLDEIRICWAYELDGKRVDAFPGRVEDLRKVVPVYESLPGWKTDITGARSLKDLPPQAIDYVKHVEKRIGCPVAVISVGPDRDQTIQVPATS